MVAVYLDSSFLVALLVPEAFSERADAFVAAEPGPFVVSDLADVEFASAIARRVRMRLFNRDQARHALSSFDAWAARSATRSGITPADVTLARELLRRLDLPLRTLDALHLAVAQRLDATLAAFDRRMIASARALGMAVATP